MFIITNLSQLVEQLGSCSRVLLADLDWFLVLEQSLIVCRSGKIDRPSVTNRRTIHTDEFFMFKASNTVPTKHVLMI